MTRRFSLGLLLVLVTTAGCVPVGVGSKDRSAAARTVSGATRLLYAPCAGEEVTTVGVFAYDGGNPSYGEPIYWLAESVGPAVVEEVTVGDTPNGFVETVPLRVALPTADLVHLPGLDQGSGFSAKLDELQSDRVLTGGYDETTEAGFRAAAGRACTTIRVLAVVVVALAPVTLVGLLTVLRRARRRALVGRCFTAWSCTGVVATLASWLLIVMRNYELTPLALGSALIGSALFGVVAGAVGILLSPVALGVQRLGAGRSLAATIVFSVASAAAPASLILVFGTDAGVPLVPIAWAVAAAVAAAVSARPIGNDDVVLPLGRRLVGSGLLAGIVLGPLGLVVLDNDPDPVTVAARRLADPASAPATADGELLAELHSIDQLESSRESELALGGAYEITVRCGGPSLQVSEGVFRDGSSSSVRRVLPCDGRPTPGSFPGMEPVRLAIVDNLEPDWSVQLHRSP